jgi:periplasmic protein TonB
MMSYRFFMFEQSGRSVASVGDIFRYFLVPLTISLLFGSGIYWLRQLLPGSTAMESSGSIQVHLLKEPNSIPVVAATKIDGSAMMTGARQNRDRPTPAESAVATTSLETYAKALPEELPADVMPPSLPPTETSLKNSVVARYERALLHHIRRFQNYPAGARRDHVQGTVFVLFSIERNGSIANIQIKASSGKPSLDEEALAALRRAQPLPPIPAGLPAELHVLLPIAFDLS